MAKNRFPDSLVLIFFMIVLAFLASYVLTPGRFDRAVDDEGKTTRRVLPGTYHVLEKEDAPRLEWHAFLTKIPKGMEDAADIIFFVFIVGGAISVIKATGAIDAFIGATIRHAGGSTILLVAVLLTLFAIGSSLIGMAEEYMPFIPILVTMCLALKLDAIVAVGIVYIGAGIGYGCAAMNPFTVLIAQDIAEVPAMSGQWYRWILLVVLLGVGIHHILKYAKRVREDAAHSLVRDVDYTEGYTMPSDVRMTFSRFLVLVVFVTGIGVFVYGASTDPDNWYLTALAGIFFGMALVCAFLGRLSPNRVARKFCQGAAELTTTALLIGFARTIEVILKDAQVIDTVVNGIANTLQGAGPSIAAGGMLAVQSVCNFLIPSGSGQAYVTMPIMAPLSDVLGVTRQTAVLAYQFGDGFTNMIVPTNALLMGMLALGRIPYQRWLRFIVPFLIKVYIIAIIALMIAVRIGY